MTTTRALPPTLPLVAARATQHARRLLRAQSDKGQADVLRAGSSVLFGLVFASVGCGGAGNQALTLRRVVLYQNGIGYFERSGELRQPSYRLRLRRHEVDDVLKTLVVIDETAGSEQRPITAVVPQPLRARPKSAGASAPADRADEDAEERSELVIKTQAADDGSTEPLLGRRRLTVAYAAPSPVWKAAYRVVLPPKQAVLDGSTAPIAATQQGVLQAWAIVDNLSGEAWNGVELTLATGAPLTFALDLRGPRFVPRPDINGQLVTPVATGMVLAETTRAPQSPPATLDSDGDRIPDRNDKCPYEPETYNGIEDEDGCPDRGRVIVSASKIEIFDQLFFAKDSARLAPQMLPLIDALTATLQHNPELTLVEVAGHACDDSDPRSISQSRADAVRSELVRRGIPASRLRARGYGSDRPLRSGSGEDACSRSRRVQFQIVQRRDEASESTASPASPASGIQAERMVASVRPMSTVQQNLGGTRYRIATPVSLPQGSSTMVALLTLRGGTEDIYLYRPDAGVSGSDRHLLRAARVHIGSALEPGPVAVFGDGGYIGEGVLGRVHAGETALIPYALDTSASLAREDRYSARPLRVLSVRAGEARVEDEALQQTIYMLQPGSEGTGRPARVFLRHPKRIGFDALDLPSESEQTADAYLIPQALKPDGPTQIVVRERRVDGVTRSLRGVPQEQSLLCPYIDGTTAAPAVLARLRDICQQQQAILSAERESDRLQRQRDELEGRGDELRDNLRAVEKISSAAALRSELLAKLSEHERRSSELEKARVARREAQATAEARLAQLLADFVFEAAK